MGKIGHYYFIHLPMTTTNVVADIEQMLPKERTKLHSVCNISTQNYHKNKAKYSLVDSANK